MNAPDVEAIGELRVCLAKGASRPDVTVPRQPVLTLIRWQQLRLKHVDEGVRVLAELQERLRCTEFGFLLAAVVDDLEINLEESPLASILKA